VMPSAVALPAVSDDLPRSETAALPSLIFGIRHSIGNEDGHES
jgi:hypothetical protein